MTYEQFRDDVLLRLRQSTTTVEIDRVLNEAERTLKNSNFSEAAIREFWRDLLDGEEHLAFKEQSQLALNRLVAYAQAVLQNRAAGAKK